MNTITPVDGDCWPACIANLFQIPFGEVAHLSCRINPSWFEETQAWLAQRGLFALQIVASPDSKWPFHQLPDNILAIACGVGEGSEGHCGVNASSQQRDLA